MSATLQGGTPTLVRVITWLPVGGIERRIVAVLPRLAARGWRVSLVCVRERGPLADDLERAGVPVDVVPFRSRLSPAGLRALAETLRRRGADVVHSHMYRSNVPATIAARIAGIRPVFCHVHNVDTWESSRQVWLDRALMPWRHAMVAVSQAVRRDVMRTLRLPAERVRLLYNGIDTEAFRPDAEARARVRGELGLPGDATVVLVPARLHPQKNPLGMLMAWQRVLAGLPANRRFVLLFAGAGDEDARLREAIAATSLGPSVRLLGRVDVMAPLYTAADLVALPSFKEGFSNAVLESLACGVPVLASDAGGNAEAIASPDVGWIHPAGDSTRLELHLRQALEEGPALADRREACRRRGLEFGIDALVDATHRLYCEALGIQP